MQRELFWRSSALGAVLTLAGCGTNAQPQQAQQGLFLSSVTQSVCTETDGEGNVLPPTFDIAIYPATGSDAAGWTCETGSADAITINGLGMTELIDVGDLDLGTDNSADDLTGVWVGGDAFQVLDDGYYCVRATPASGDPNMMPVTLPYSTLIAPRTAQNMPVHVPPGGTAETVFAFQCDGDTISALDIVVLVNEGPSINDFWYGDSGKFVLTCEQSEFNVQWTSPQTDDVKVICEAFDGPQPGYEFDPSTPTVPVGDTILDWTGSMSYAPALAGTPYTTTFEPFFDSAGTYYIYCNIVNSSGQVTTFQSLMHVSTPAVDFCYYTEAVPEGAAELARPMVTPVIDEPTATTSGGGFTIGDDFNYTVDLTRQVEFRALSISGNAATNRYDLNFGTERVGQANIFGSIKVEAENAVGDRASATLYMHSLNGGEATKIGFGLNGDGRIVNSQTINLGIARTLTKGAEEIGIVQLEAGTVEVEVVKVMVADEERGLDLRRVTIHPIYSDATTNPTGTSETQNPIHLTPGMYAALSCHPDDFIEVDAKCAVGANEDVAPCEVLCPTDEEEPLPEPEPEPEPQTCEEHCDYDYAAASAACQGDQGCEQQAQTAYAACLEACDETPPPAEGSLYTVTARSLYVNDGTLDSWSLVGDLDISPSEPGPDNFTSLAMNASGALIASGGGGNAQDGLYDVDPMTGAISVRCLMAPSMLGLTYAPDGSLYGTLGGSVFKIVLDDPAPGSCTTQTVYSHGFASTTGGLVAGDDGTLYWAVWHLTPSPQTEIFQIDPTEDPVTPVSLGFVPSVQFTAFVLADDGGLLGFTSSGGSGSVYSIALDPVSASFETDTTPGFQGAAAPLP